MVNITSKGRAILLTAIVLGLSSVLFVFFKPNPWETYYRKKLNDPPRPLVVKAVKMNILERKAPLHAVDFGSGVGNETLFLLKSGFDVTAIDRESMAFRWLYKRIEGQPYLGHLKTIRSDFSRLDWKAVSETDLFLASFAIPFCPPKDFKKIWHEITSHIKPGGYFVGQFFDPTYQGYSDRDRRRMTFQTQPEVLKLLEDFDIKYLTRKKEVGQSGGGANIVAEYYEVIAQKKKEKRS